MVIGLPACQKYEIAYKGQHSIDGTKLQRLPDMYPEEYQLDIAIEFGAINFELSDLTFDSFLWIEIYPCGSRSWDTIGVSAVYLDDEVQFQEPLPDDDGIGAESLYAVFSKEELERVNNLDNQDTEELCAGLRYHRPYGVSDTSNSVSFPVR